MLDKIKDLYNDITIEKLSTVPKESEFYQKLKVCIINPIIMRFLHIVNFMGSKIHIRFVHIIFSLLFT